MEASEPSDRDPVPDDASCAALVGEISSDSDDLLSSSGSEEEDDEEMRLWRQAVIARAMQSIEVSTAH